MDLLQKSKENAQSWLSPTFDEQTQKVVRELLEGNIKIWNWGQEVCVVSWE